MKVEGQVNDAVKRGARVLAGGKRPSGDAFAKGNFYLPTLLVEVDESSKVIQEEVFGPALPVMAVKDLDEAIQKANNSIYGLGSSIWTRSLDSATQAAERLEAGYTWVNSPQIIFDELPFGGGEAERAWEGARRRSAGLLHGDESVVIARGQ